MFFGPQKQINNNKNRFIRLKQLVWGRKIMKGSRVLIIVNKAVVVRVTCNIYINFKKSRFHA